MFEFKACVVLKIKEFTQVNDCFQNKHNAEIGHYRRTLNSYQHTNQVLLVIQIEFFAYAMPSLVYGANGQI